MGAWRHGAKNLTGTGDRIQPGDWQRMSLSQTADAIGGRTVVEVAPVAKAEQPQTAREQAWRALAKLAVPQPPDIRHLLSESPVS